MCPMYELVEHEDVFKFHSVITCQDPQSSFINFSKRNVTTKYIHFHPCSCDPFKEYSGLRNFERNHRYFIFI